jgi:hypothetical protein
MTRDQIRFLSNLSKQGVHYLVKDDQGLLHEVKPLLLEKRLCQNPKRKEKEERESHR